MKNYLILIFSLFLLSACKNSPAGEALGTVSEDFQSFDGQNRPLYKLDTVVTAEGTIYELTYRGGRMDASVQIKVRKDGKLIHNQDYKTVGSIKNIYHTDLNGDGQEDLLFYTTTEDATEIGNAYLVSLQGNQIDFKYILPFMDKVNSVGYFGRDSFYLDGGNVMRTFPVYSLNQYNQKKLTDKKRYLTYKFAQSDTLKASAAEDK